MAVACDLPPTLLRPRLIASGSKHWAQRPRRGNSRADLFRYPEPDSPGRQVGHGSVRRGASLGAASRCPSSRCGTPQQDAVEVQASEAGAEAPSRCPTMPSGRRSRLGAVGAAYLGASPAAGVTIEELAGIQSAGSIDVEEKFAATMRRELAEMRTGEDAIAFFSRHGHSSGARLFHCIRAPVPLVASAVQPAGVPPAAGPWDLVIVPEERVQPEHFTISAHGVVHFQPGQLSECTPIADWVRQCMMYRVLTSMNFFRFYAHRKTLAQWRASASYAVYCRRRQRLARRCLLAKPLFVGRLMQIKGLACKVEELPVLQIPTQCCQLDEFADSQSSLLHDPASGAQRELERCLNSLVELLVGLTGAVHGAKEAALLPLRALPPNSRSKPVAQEKQEVRERARRQQVAQEDEAQLGSCIRLADCQLQAALSSLVGSAAQKLARQVIGTTGEPLRKLFLVSAGLKDGNAGGGALLEPAPEEFERVLDRHWEELITLADSMPPLATERVLARYALQGGRKVGQTIRELLAGDRSWLACMAGIRQGLCTQLEQVRDNASEMYEQFRRIRDFGSAWNEAAFAKKKHTFKSLSAHMSLMTEFKEDLGKFRSQKHVGVLLIDGRAFRDSLTSIPETGLSAVRPLMAQLARDQISAARSLAGRLIRELDERPTERAALEAFGSACKAAAVEEKALQTCLDEALSMHRLLRQHGVRLPLDDQVLLEDLAAKERELSQESLPAAMGYINQQRRCTELATVVVTFDAGFEGHLDLISPRA